MSRPKVLSIVGPGRSGTTILAGILGGTPGFTTVGELRWLWRRGLLEQRPCGCGQPPEKCPVWSEVLARGLAERTATPAEIATAQAELAGRRNRFRAIRSGTSGDADGWPALRLMREVTAGLVRAIADVTGSSVIVDSSKRAQDAAILAGLADVDHYVLHMVRDPGATTFSWQRRDKVVRTADGTRTMATRGLLSSVARWNEIAWGVESLRRRVPPERWMFLRYEDFVADPRATVSRIIDLLGEDGRPPFLDRDTVVLPESHTVAGNPDRFKVGEVEIRADDEWRRRLPRHRQLAVRALTWPLLLRYGYPVRLGGPAPGHER